MLAISYDAHLDADGIGAQLQRQAAIFSLAKFLRIDYLHTPIRSFGFNPGDGVHGDLEKKALVLSEINKTFGLPGLNYFDYSELIDIEQLTFSHIIKFIKLKNSNEKILIRIKNPFPVFDQLRFSYNEVNKSWSLDRQKIDQKRSDNLKIDLHIRRAVSPKSTLKERNYQRYLETEWYVSVTSKLLKFINSANGSIQLRIHTDGTIDNRQIDVNNIDLDESTKALWIKQGFVDDSGILTQHTEDLYSKFEKFGDVKIIQEIMPHEALNQMISSNLLIGGKSSFSFVAGLARNPKSVIFPKFWHKCPNDWIQPDNSGYVLNSDLKRIEFDNL